MQTSLKFSKTQQHVYASDSASILSDVLQIYIFLPCRVVSVAVYTYIYLCDLNLLGPAFVPDSLTEVM